MASFDSMAGKELSGEWLHYFTFEKESADPDEVPIPRQEGSKKFDLRTYIGVDPSVSLSDSADKFAIALIGVTKDNANVFLLRLWAGRIPFHEQLEKIEQWNSQYKPEYIFVESVAYQRVLADQAMRLPGMPNIVPVFPPQGVKKWERILSMAPLFRTGRVRIHRHMHREFIEEWLDYDSTLKNPKDDCLDAVEIVLRMAGVMQAPLPEAKDEEERPLTLQELANRHRRPMRYDYDPEMGADF